MVSRPQSDGHTAEIADSEDGLERGLHNRHIQMIALGGAIGVGLFMVSGKAIHNAGPALILCYALAGAMVFLIVRALGELTLYRPVSGSFASYATEFIGRFTGFFAGWTYWLTWVVAGMAELTAIGMYVGYWWPSIPQWLTAVVVLVLLFGANMLSVRIFGETEFWFALIKVVAIIAMIIVGVVVLVFGVGHLADSASVSHLWKNGGLFPNGGIAALVGLQAAVFAFFGLEMVGVAAGEAHDPKRTLPKAINSMMGRIVFFYVGALVVIMSLVPWNKLNPTTSPFLVVFEQTGIPAAATIVYLVVVSAALSAGASCVFSTGRMLFGLAGMGDAPKRLHKVNKRKVPAGAITVSSLVMVLGVVLNYLDPKNALVYVAAIGSLGGITTWAIILIAHLRYRLALRRGEVAASDFRMPGSPWTNYIALVFLALVVVLIGTNKELRLALYISPIWLAVVGLGYYFGIRRPELAKAKVAAGHAVAPRPELAEEAA